jgi:heterodisulfide reductase subunit C
MKYVISEDTLRSDLLDAVEELSGHQVRNCYQCGKCTAGCPIAAEMDLPPNQVMRFLQLGLGDVPLRSKTIWLCASCETCTTRCPRELDPAAVMDALRILALQKRVPLPMRAVPFFNRTFLRLIRKYGRVFEMELIGRFNTGTLHFFKDMTKAPKLFFKGRLKLWPSFKGRRTARPVFKDLERMASARSEGPAAEEPEQATESDQPSGGETE